MESVFNLLRKIYVKFPILLFDILAIPISCYIAYTLRYNFGNFILPFTTVDLIVLFTVLITVQTCSYYYFRVYRGIWRFFSFSDATRIMQATATATIIVVPIYYFLSYIGQIPRSVFPLYCLVHIATLSSGRLLRRYTWELVLKKHNNTFAKRVLIIGAGNAGESIVRDLNRSHIYYPMGFVDDNVLKKGLEVHGVRVLGSTKDIAKLVIKYNIDLIFIAIPSANSVEMQKIVGECQRCSVQYRTLPSLDAINLNSVRVDAGLLRDVSLEDLLGRDQVKLQWDKIYSTLFDKVVLVTGGGGSIGSELCRQILSCKPNRLIIIDNSEFNLYKVDRELREAFPNLSIELALINITDVVAVNHIFQIYKPEIVFHAAAYKHVPMLESQIRVAAVNNILGTIVIAEAGITHEVKKFILISSDKAVNPTNIMGATKRVAEIYCQNLDLRVNTQFITVRFGNVLGSVGSVVPLFKSQLEKGGPLTVTHKDMKRYFMTISEASQLILQAMANGDGGEIFVLDMGKPVSIDYLAHQMITLYGKIPGKDIQIQYTGLRPGEKLYEELFHSSEYLIKTEHEKILKARFREVDWEELNQALRLLKIASNNYSDDEIIILIKNLVPEFQCSYIVEPNLIT